MRLSCYLCALCLLSVLCVSCEYKELCYDHNHWANVQTVIDWQLSPKAQPKSMTVQYYNMNGTEPIRYDYGGRKGGWARLNPGTYRSVAYNNDTETILLRNMGLYNTLEAYTRQSSIEEGTQLTRAGMPRAANAENEPVILEPDTLWAAASEPILLNAGDTTDVKVLPKQRYCDVEVTIRNVPNLQYTGSFGGALSGLAPSVLVASGQLGETPATQAFPCYAIDETTLQMRFRIFGHCPHRDQGETFPHLLTVYAILADGTKWYYTMDVTNQMHDRKQNPDDTHIAVELEDLPVPKPIVNGSGFHPTVDGWQGEEIEVGM